LSVPLNALANPAGDRAEIEGFRNGAGVQELGLRGFAAAAGRDPVRECARLFVAVAALVLRANGP